MSNISSDPVLQLAFWIAAATALLTVLLAGMIIFLRISRHLQQRRELAFVAQWRPLLMRILLGDGATVLPALPRRDQFLFLKHWNHFQESMRGSASLRLNGAALSLGGNAMAHRLLHHRNQTERLLAILTLGHLRDASAWDELLTLTDSTNSTISVYAARALMQIEPQKAARHIMPLLLQREDWDITRVASLLHESQAVLGEVLAQNLAAPAKDPLLRGLKLAEALHLQIPPSVQLHLLGPEQPVEVVIAALRIATGAPVLAAIRAMADHDDWRVRVQVAKALGRIGEASDVPRLTKLLQDRQWWVRYRAAHALASLPFLDQAELARLHAGLSDRYAQDILGQVFAERSSLPKRS